MSAHEAIIVVLAPLFLIGLWLFLKYSRLGAAIRALLAKTCDAALLIGL